MYDRSWLTGLISLRREPATLQATVWRSDGGSRDELVVSVGDGGLELFDDHRAGSSERRPRRRAGALRRLRVHSQQRLQALERQKYLQGKVEDVLDCVILIRKSVILGLRRVAL